MMSAIHYIPKKPGGLETMKKKSGYNIGDVSRICGLSIKTLHYYDKKGIFVPALRDKSNGYRYYSEDQILEALAIREMKLRGINILKSWNTDGSLPLEMLDNILNKRKQEIKNEINDLEKQLGRVENTHNLLRQALQAMKGSSGVPHREVTVSEMPKRICLHTRQTSRIFYKEIFWDRIADIYRLRDKYDYIAQGPVMGVFHEHYTRAFFFEYGDLEILLPISGTALPGEHLKEFGGFLVATATYIGSYFDSMLPVYVDIVKWVEDNNFEIAGDPIEEYIAEFTHGVAKDEYVTRINFPVQAKE